MMETTVTLRVADAADRDAVMGLYAACVHSEDCCWNEYYPGEEEFDADVRDRTLYLWETQGKLLGAVSLLTDDDVEHVDLPFARSRKPCVLCRLCVDPRRRHEKLGAALLIASERKAAALGFDSMHLMADVRQKAAQSLYCHAGYRELGEVEMYSNRYIVMEKAL